MKHIAFTKYEVGDTIKIDFTEFKIVDVKVFGTIRTLTAYEYTLKEILK